MGQRTSYQCLTNQLIRAPFFYLEQCLRFYGALSYQTLTYQAPYNTPLVDQTDPFSRSSCMVAISRALPNALKLLSAI